MTERAKTEAEALFGYEVCECRALVGAREAYLCGDVILVSPAMRSLMKNSTPDELERLLQAIPLKRGPDLRKMNLAWLEFPPQALQEPPR